VLGVDPGLLATGWGVISSVDGALTVVDTGIIATDAARPLAMRVAAVYGCVLGVLQTHAPDLLVLEDLYADYKFPRTAILMAHARGVVCLAAAQWGVDVLALAPAEVKRAIAAHGAASKSQIQHGVQRMLGLAETPRSSHVADALALALTGFWRVGARRP